jgi:pimeloyl-ACP methyl ester carboxylesterase
MVIRHVASGLTRPARPVLMALVLFLTALAWGQVSPGASALLHYTSVADGSSQPYGIYVPTPYTAAAPHPVIFIGHGFGGHASSSFSSYQQTFANTNGCLLVQLEGRGNTFYDGMGECDLFDVLAALRASYTLDTTRLYFEGASMGATGAYRMGARYPGLFAAVAGCDGWGDYRSWHTQYYAPTRNPSEVEPSRVPNLEMGSPLDLAENAKWLPAYFIVDTADTSVWQENTYRLTARLAQLGTATTETDYQYRVDQNVGGGHCAGYDQTKLYPWLIGKTLQTAPTHVVWKTKRLKYGGTAWVRVDRLLNIDPFATVDALVGSGNAVSVTTANVAALTLTLDASLVNTALPVTITINGLTAYTGPAGTIALYAATDTAGAVTGWTTTDPSAGTLLKRAGLEGPIGEAFTGPFLVAYGTGATDQSDANAFCSLWNTWMNGGTAVVAAVPASAVSSADIANRSLVLYGTTQSNTLIAQIASRLPIQVTDSAVVVGNQTFTGTQYGVNFVYPNPLNPNRLVLVCHGTIPGLSTQRPGKDLEALPWYWGDYVVFDKTKTAEACVQTTLNYLPATYVAAGYFDTRWTLKTARFRPDLAIQAPGDTSWVGNGVTGVAQVRSLLATTSVPTHFRVAVQNAGAVSDVFAVTASAPPSGVRVQYTDVLTGQDVTAAIQGTGGWATSLAEDGYRLLDVTITLDTLTSYRVDICATSGGNAAATDTVTAAVALSNTPPVATNVSASTREDVATTVTLLATDVDGGTLSYRIVSTSGAGTASLSGNQLTVVPTPNASGTVTVTYVANDGQADSNTATATVVVSPVNDPPSFIIGANISVAQNNGAYTKSGWATSISAGPPDEGSQTVSFLVSAGTPTLFSVAPAVSPAGTLTFTPAASAKGTTSVTVRAQDNGGTALGGLDTSAAQTFTITITAANHPPTFTKVATASTSKNSAVVSLSAKATDADGDVVSYLWSCTAGPGTVTFSAPTAAITTATVTRAGTYTFMVTASDGKAAVTSQVSVTLTALVTTVTVTPNTMTLILNQTQPFTATLLDQFGQPMTGTVTWKASAGTITTAGLYKATRTGTITVTATANSISGTARVTVKTS